MAKSDSSVHRDLTVASPLLKGDDIRKYQSAVNGLLKNFDLHGHLKLDGQFGERTAELGDKVAYALGLEAQGDSPHHISHVVTQEEQKFVRDPSKRTDAQKERSVRRVKELHDREDSSNKVRASVIEYCKWGVANTSSIHYSHQRPIDNLDNPKSLPLYTDCSGFATLSHKFAKAPDPNGHNYDPAQLAYTGTELQACKHISAVEAKPADLLVFGNFPGSHVVILAENLQMCYSHGQEAGPLYISVAAEISAHSGQTLNYLRIIED